MSSPQLLLVGFPTQLMNGMYMLHMLTMLLIVVCSYVQASPWYLFKGGHNNSKLPVIEALTLPLCQNRKMYQQTYRQKASKHL